MANENIVTGRYYRVLSDAAQQIWDRISFWSKASDTEANDGIDLETKVGAINGITDDLSCEDSSIAASSVAVNRLNESLGGLSFGYDSASGKYGYWKKEADTEVFVPFKSGGLTENREKISGTSTTRDYALVQVFSIDVYQSGSASCNGGTLVQDNTFTCEAGSTDLTIQEKFYADVPQGSSIVYTNTSYSCGMAFGYY